MNFEIEIATPTTDNSNAWSCKNPKTTEIIELSFSAFFQDEYIKNMLGIQKEEIPGLHRETVPVIPTEELKINSLDVTKNEEIPSIELPKVEVPVEPSIEIPKVEEIKLPETVIEKEENPNVYAQTLNNDFVNISSLNEESTASPVKSALSGLDIVSTESELFGGNNLSVEEKETSSITNSDSPDLSKIKLATAIKLAKDSVEEIKKAGYNVKVEEIDTTADYQIIIRLFRKDFQERIGLFLFPRYIPWLTSRLWLSDRWYIEKERE